MITEEQYQTALKIVEEYEYEQMLLNEPDDEEDSEPEECDDCGRMDCVCYFAQDCHCGAWIMSKNGHWPHWVECDKNKPEDRYFWEGIVNTKFYDSTNPNGTYELCGPKVQGNPENLTEHVLLRHGSQTIAITKEEITFNKLKEFLTALPIEGIVFHHQDGRMCKLRKSDYGIKR